MLKQNILKCVEAEQKRLGDQDLSSYQWIPIIAEEAGTAASCFYFQKNDTALVKLIQVAASAASAKRNAIIDCDGIRVSILDLPKPFSHKKPNCTVEKWMLLITIALGKIAQHVNNGDTIKCVVEFAYLEDIAISAIFSIIEDTLVTKPLIKALEDFCSIKFK